MGNCCTVAVRKDGSHEKMLALSNAAAGAVAGLWVAMAFGVLYAVGYFVAMCLRNMHLDAIAQPTPYSAYANQGLSLTAPYFLMLLPLLSCISFSDSSLYERNNHLLACCCWAKWALAVTIAQTGRRLLRRLFAHICHPGTKYGAVPDRLSLKRAPALRLGSVSRLYILGHCQ